jgi:hypothetical protein
VTDTESASHPAQALIGVALFSYDMPIELGKIREFALATAATDEVYRRPGAPVPPTFLATSTWWEPTEPALLDALGLDLTRILHGGQDYRFFGPVPRAGEVLSASTSVESVVEREGKRGGAMTVITVLTEFHRSDGSVAAHGRSTIIEQARR